MYNVRIMGVLPFLVYRLKRHGLKLLTKLTDGGYPGILALGICYLFNWKLRLMHELGHEYSLDHVMKEGFVMHPWGVFRGDLIGSSECDQYTRNMLKKRYQEVLNEHGF
ncbi:MAG: hypothetical protein R2741_08470 [Methanolobus sp.]